MRSRRAALSPSVFHELSAKIERAALALPELKNADTVHIYVSAVNNEVHTRSLIESLLALGKRVVVPRCAPEPHRLQHLRIYSLEDLRPSRFGLLEPEYRPENEVDPAQFGLIFSPLMAFDRFGRRLGFGGGYYDSLFQQCTCPKIGLAFSFQEVSDIPMEPHDRTLDIIVTEKEIIHFR